MLKRQTIKQEQSIVDTFIKAINAKVAAGEISMSELSRKAGVARPFLYRVLSGEQIPTMTIAEKIARAVGLAFNLKEIPDLVA